MSYAFAPARCVASKNGDFRYQGPKNKVLWASLRGMSSPPEDWAGNAHRLFEEFFPAVESARNRADPEQLHLVLQRFAKSILQRPRVESELAARLRVVREIGHSRHISKPLGPGQRGDRAEEPGRRMEPVRWDPGAPRGQVERVDQRVPGT